MARITSLDGAAWGFVRHRFVRTLAASFYVLSTLAVISLIAQPPPPGSGGWLGAGLGQTIFAILFLVLWVTAFVGVTSGLLEGVHRRVTALCLIAGAGYLAYWFALRAVAPLEMGAGFELARIGEYRPAFLIIVATELIVRVVSVVIALEVCVHGVWQLITSAEGFIAARGWRPAFARVQAGFPRQLGMPGYIATFGRGGFGLSVIYFIVAVCNLGLLMTPVTPFLLLAWDAPGEMLLAAAALSAVALLILGYAFSNWAARAATRQYQKVREWDARPPVVFLRTFDQDQRRLKARGGDAFTKLPAGVGRARTLDEILLEHASPYGPVLAIGDPRDPTPPLGAARIFVPGQGLGWQDVVTSLVSASKAVVMCPNTTEGVKWELDLISTSTDPAKVIYLANPELSRDANVALFQRLSPVDAQPDVPSRQVPIAAFLDPKKGWRVLTARRVSLEAYVIGLNLALQRIFGREGVEPIEPVMTEAPASSGGA